MAMLPPPVKAVVTFPPNEYCPSPILFAPVVTYLPVFSPIAIFPAPVVSENSASLPIATVPFAPVVVLSASP